MEIVEQNSYKAKSMKFIGIAAPFAKEMTFAYIFCFGDELREHKILYSLN